MHHTILTIFSTKQILLRSILYQIQLITTQSYQVLSGLTPSTTITCAWFQNLWIMKTIHPFALTLGSKYLLIWSITTGSANFICRTSEAGLELARSRSQQQVSTEIVFGTHSVIKTLYAGQLKLYLILATGTGYQILHLWTMHLKVHWISVTMHVLQPILKYGLHQILITSRFNLLLLWYGNHNWLLLDSVLLIQQIWTISLSIIRILLTKLTTMHNGL